MCSQSSSQELRAPALDRCPESVTLARGAIAGLVGGVVGTIVMDLALLAMHRTVGAPRSASFATIGDAAAILCAKLGIRLTGGSITGAGLHFLIGSGLGVVFGGSLARLGTPSHLSPKKAAGLGAVYALVASQPLLAAAAITLKMSRAETAKWYGISMMHALYGAALGAIAGKGILTSRQKADYL